MQKICNEPLDVHSQAWDDISEDCKDFVCQLLDRDVSHRPTAREISQHRWLAEAEGAKSEISKKVLEDLRDFGDLEVEFRKLDKEGSGTILKSELASAFVRQLSMTEAEAKALFEKLDLSGDDEIEYSEFIAAANGSRYMCNEALIKQAFERLDVDHSGVISIQDLRQVFGDKFNGNTVEEILAQVDYAQNGVITYDEFVRAMMELQPDEKNNCGPLELRKRISHAYEFTSVGRRNRFRLHEGQKIIPKTAGMVYKASQHFQRARIYRGQPPALRRGWHTPDISRHCSREFSWSPRHFVWKIAHNCLGGSTRVNHGHSTAEALNIWILRLIIEDSGLPCYSVVGTHLTSLGIPAETSAWSKSEGAPGEGAYAVMAWATSPTSSPAMPPQVIAIHQRCGSVLGGIHLEVTGQSSVTEVVGGSMNITEDMPESPGKGCICFLLGGLLQNYETYCDPRLNYAQAIEATFRVANEMPSAERAAKQGKCSEALRNNMREVQRPDAIEIPTEIRFTAISEKSKASAAASAASERSARRAAAMKQVLELKEPDEERAMKLQRKRTGPARRSRLHSILRSASGPRCSRLGPSFEHPSKLGCYMFTYRICGLLLLTLSRTEEVNCEDDVQEFMQPEALSSVQVHFSLEDAESGQDLFEAHPALLQKRGQTHLGDAKTSGLRLKFSAHGHSIDLMFQRPGLKALHWHLRDRHIYAGPHAILTSVGDRVVRLVRRGTAYLDLELTKGQSLLTVSTGKSDEEYLKDGS
eukprot:g31347.t1